MRKPQGEPPSSTTSRVVIAHWLRALRNFLLVRGQIIVRAPVYSSRRDAGGSSIKIVLFSPAEHFYKKKLYRNKTGGDPWSSQGPRVERTRASYAHSLIVSIRGGEAAVCRNLYRGRSSPAKTKKKRIKIELDKCQSSICATLRKEAVSILIQKNCQDIIKLRSKNK